MTSPAVALTATGDALVSAKPIADRINAAHEAFEAAERRALEHAVRAGRLLEEVKQDLKRRFGHGHFGRWIKRHCRFDWRRGEEYMQAAKWVSANAREAANLTYTEVLRRAARPRRSGSLSARFVVPPFTVLDARAGYWQQRKREWFKLGIRGEEGRPNDLIDYASLRKYRPSMTLNMSVFDPVLGEVVYHWFTPGPCRVLDPFAGDATKGLVAATLGHSYTGIELRPEQVAANEAQAAAMGLTPKWRCGDSMKLREHLAAEDAFDLVFTSPPYYDLEVYHGGAADGSTLGTYSEFLSWYADVFEQAVARLRPNRFVVVKVGDIRDPKTGAYRNLVGDSITCFLKLGLYLWNTAVLVTPVGSLPLRVAKPFSRHRKLGNAHQVLLVFYKGDPTRISTVFPSQGLGMEGVRHRRAAAPSELPTMPTVPAIARGRTGGAKRGRAARELRRPPGGTDARATYAPQPAGHNPPAAPAVQHHPHRESV